jgi:hypothetical protein
MKQSVIRDDQADDFQIIIAVKRGKDTICRDWEIEMPVLHFD